MLCQKCGVEAPTKMVKFHQNIGAIAVFFTKSVEGRLCKTCVHKTFWKMTGVSATLGWWGVISFIITPFLIVNNVGWYVARLGMPAVPPDAAAPQLGPKTRERIKQYLPDMVARLEAGEDFIGICERTAEAAGVTPGQVARFLQETFQNDD